MVSRAGPTGPPGFRLWFAFLGGPVAWSAQLLVNYFVVALACHGQLSATLLVHETVTLATGLVALAALLLARSSRHAVAPVSTEGEPPRGRSAFLARTGLLVSALFLGVIAAGALPTLLLPACA